MILQLVVLGTTISIYHRAKRYLSVSYHLSRRMMLGISQRHGTNMTLLFLAAPQDFDVRRMIHGRRLAIRDFSGHCEKSPGRISLKPTDKSFLVRPYVRYI